MDATKVVYLTAGAGGMYCGSCMHDNALAKALMQLGLDVMLVPTYTPIRTDEDDVSVDQVFFGGINVYLQQKFPPLRWLPGFLDRFLDNPKLIRRLTSRSIDMPTVELGKLALSMLKGRSGNQRKEVKRLTSWLVNQAKPDVVLFTNILIGGCIPEIKRSTGKPVLVTLQGDDVFLDSLPELYRAMCIEQIKRLVKEVDGFIVHSEFFRDYMNGYFSIPVDKIHVTPLGIDTSEFENSSAPNRSGNVLGYLARLAPEKGLHHLVSAFIELKKSDAVANLQLRVAGWLSSQNQDYADEQFERIREAGFESDFQYLGSVDLTEKLAFLNSIDVLSVPTDYLEPKGLYVLEAMAAGVPVVQPAHGCFPDLIQQSRGGLLHKPGDPVDLAAKLAVVFNDTAKQTELADHGRNFVFHSRNSLTMAMQTAELLDKFVGQ